MEDIPRDLEKTIEAGPTGTDFSKRARRWDILIVKDDGKVISVPWFKKIIYLVLFLFSLFFVVSLTLLIINRSVQLEKKALLASLERAMERTLILQNDIDQKERELEALVERQKQEDIFHTSPSANGNMEAVKEGAKESKPSTTEVENEPPKDEIAAQTSSKASVEKESALSSPSGDYKIEIDDFSTAFKPYNHSLKIWFVIKNISEKEATLSGNIFVILKPDGKNEDEWLVYPPSAIVSGRPGQTSMGQYFSIRKFKTVRFVVTDPLDYKMIKRATVFVYADSGSLILEQDYVLNIATQ